MAEPEHPWVGRGGIKLAHALDVFGIDVHGPARPRHRRLDRRLHRRAAAARRARTSSRIDVGHGQLHWKTAQRSARHGASRACNARALSRADLPDLGDGAGIVTIDVSFISLKHILPVVPALLAPDGDVVALVKPQFEAGREEVGAGGLVRDPAIHARVVDEVTAAAAEVGLTRVGLVDSPITGAEGNQEFLMHLQRPSVDSRLDGESPMRVGVVTKPSLTAARETLVGLGALARASISVDAVWTPEAAELDAAWPARSSSSREELPRARRPRARARRRRHAARRWRTSSRSRAATCRSSASTSARSASSPRSRTRSCYAALEAAIAGRVELDERMMLRGTVGDHSRVALNDIVFTRTALSRMIDLAVTVGEQFVTSVKADGLIVASPTGSTAYNLAAGGPIVHPAMDAIVLTPIAPHTLDAIGPIVIPAEREMRVRAGVANAGAEIYVTFDGQHGFALAEGDEVAISRAPKPIRLVRVVDAQLLRSAARKAEVGRTLIVRDSEKLSDLEFETSRVNRRSDCHSADRALAVARERT